MSIEQRGDRFRVRLRRGGAAVSATFPSMTEAEAFRAAWIAALATGAPLPEQVRPEAPPAAPPRPLTVFDACRELSAGIKSGAVRDRRGRVYKPASVRSIERRLRLHVVPRIGAVPLTTLRRGDVRRLVDDLSVEASPSVARDALGALGVVMRLQVDRDVLDLNPCSGVRVPAVDQRPARVLTREEMVVLQAAADADEDPAIGHLLALALATGARRGELLAIAWGPGGLDLGAGLAHIRFTKDPVAGLVSPKNGEARSVHLGAGVIARLRRWRIASERSQEGELVFPRDPWESWSRVRKAAKLADPQPRFHDLRHAVCSALRASGLESHEVAAIVGHKDGGRLVDRVYAHALPDRVAGAGRLMEAWMASEG